MHHVLKALLLLLLSSMSLNSAVAAPQDVTQETTQEMPRFHKIYYAKIINITRNDNNIVIIFKSEEISKQYYTTLAITACLPTLSNPRINELENIKTISFLNNKSEQGWILDMGEATGENVCLGLKDKRSAGREQYILQHSLEYHYEPKPKL